MANELTNSIKSVAEKVVSYVDQAAKLTVVTKYIEVGTGTADFKGALPAASTLIKLDGDSESVIPVRKAANGSGLEVDTTLFELHQSNVAKAIEYRTRMMDALLQTLKDVTGK